MKDRTRIVLGCVVGSLLLLALFNLFSVPISTRRPPKVDYSSFVADVDGGKVEEVTFRGSGGMAVRRRDGRIFESYVPHMQVIPALADRLLAKGATVSARPSPSDEDVPSALSLLASRLPLIVFYGLLYFAFAQPLLAIARQVEALVKTMQEHSSPGAASPAA